MRFLVGISKREILDYLRLEEDEDTAELLKTSSLLRVGSIDTNGVKVHYWSYPTPCSVAWVSFSSEGALSTEIEGNVPHAIRDATKPREKHPMRSVERASPPPDRSPISAPKWVPSKHAPVCHYFPVWEERIQFHQAAKAFSARPSREDVGYTALTFCIKLTSGRYALFEAPEHDQGSVRISLELEEDDETRKDEECMGFVRVCDIREILSAMGRQYDPPRFKYPYEWRE